MKQRLQAMYEERTRVSSWIEDLQEMPELINPAPISKTKKSERAQAEKEARKQLKEQRENERQQKKAQAEALKAAEKVAKKIMREKKRSRQASSSESSESSFEVPALPSHVALGKRKASDDTHLEYIRTVSSSSTASSSSSSSSTSPSTSYSDLSRMPSLTWSDSGDEQPYKRQRLVFSYHSFLGFADMFFRTSPMTPELPLSSLSGFEPPFNLADLSTLDFTLIAPQTPARGQKRSRDDDDPEVTPQAQSKRPKTHATASVDPNPIDPLAPFDFSFMSSPNRLPTSTSTSTSPTPVNFDSLFGSEPEPVELTPPDPNLPVEFGLFNWNNPSFDMSGAGAGTVADQFDFSGLLEFVNQHPAPVPTSTESVTSFASLPTSAAQPSASASAGQDQHQNQNQYQHLPLPLDISQFDVSAFQNSDFLFDPSQPILDIAQTQPHQPVEMAYPQPQPLDMSSLPQLDMTNLMSLMSAEGLSHMGFSSTNSDTLPSTPVDYESSRASSVAPWFASEAVTPAPISEVVVEVDQKALIKEQKRRELREKKAKLEAEQKRLAELERELEED